MFSSLDLFGNFDLKKEFACIFMITLWYCIWDYRNRLTHSGETDFKAFVRHFELLVMEFSEQIVLEAKATPSEPRVERWKCPHSGWLKLNTDATLCDGKVALAFVIRNENGVIIHLASKLVDCETALEAEILAILLATEEAEALGWNKIIWSTDSANSAKEINSSKDPDGWNTRDNILHIKARFAIFNWQIRWNHRSSNFLDDKVARDSFNCSFPFYFDACNMEAFPTSFLDISLFDCLGGLCV